VECREEKRTRESDNIRRNKHKKCTKREMAYGIYSGGIKMLLIIFRKFLYCNLKTGLIGVKL
jgi:hypothetical protein